MFIKVGNERLNSDISNENLNYNIHSYDEHDSFRDFFCMRSLKVSPTSQKILKTSSSKSDQI